MMKKSFLAVLSFAIIHAAVSLHAAGVTIPAGTEITVNLIDGINSDYTGAGERFRASIDDPVVVGNKVVIPRGANATVQVVKVEHAGTIKGSEAISVRLYDITVRGTRYDVASDYAQIKGEGKGEKTAKRSAGLGIAGALVGAVAGGGKGAAIGASIGAGSGLVYSAAKGSRLQIPPESRLAFVLRAPLPLK
jgi:hypothetical protein